MRHEEADHELGFDVNGDIKASRDYIINQGSIQGLSFCVEPEVQRVGASCLGTLEETFDDWWRAWLAVHRFWWSSGQWYYVQPWEHAFLHGWRYHGSHRLNFCCISLTGDLVMLRLTLFDSNRKGLYRVSFQGVLGQVHGCWACSPCTRDVYWPSAFIETACNRRPVFEVSCWLQVISG